MKTKSAVVLVACAFWAASGCGPGLEPPKANTGAVPTPDHGGVPAGVAGVGAGFAGAAAAAGSGATPSRGGAGAGGSKGSAGQGGAGSSADAGIEDDAGE